MKHPRPFLTCLLLLLVPVLLLGNDKVDALEQQLAQHSGEERMYFLRVLCRHKLQTAPRQALMHGEELLRLDQAFSSSTYLQSYTFYLTGKAALYLNQWEKAIAYLSTANRLQQQLCQQKLLSYRCDDYQLMDAVLALGTAFYGNAQYAQSDSCLLLAQRMAKSQHDTSTLRRVYLRRGHLSRSQGAYPQALQCYRRVVQYVQAGGPPAEGQAASALLSMGLVHELMGQPDSAQVYFKLLREALPDGAACHPEATLPFIAPTFGLPHAFCAMEHFSPLPASRMPMLKRLQGPAAAASPKAYKQSFLDGYYTLLSEATALRDQFLIDYARHITHRLAQGDGYPPREQLGMYATLVEAEQCLQRDSLHQAWLLHYLASDQLESQHVKALQLLQWQGEAELRNHPFGYLSPLLGITGGLVSLVALVVLVHARRRAHLMGFLKHQQERLMDRLEFFRQKSQRTDSLNRKLHQLSSRLEASLKAYEREASMIAHDLRSPFSKVMALAQMLPEADQVSEQQAHYLKLINQSVQEGEQLLQRLLMPSPTREEGPAEGLDLEEVFQELLVPIRLQATRKHQQIQFACEHALPPLSMPRLPLVRVLENLLSNAIKFSPLHATVWVKVWHTANHFYISIRDQGPGFSPADQQKLFKLDQTYANEPTAGERSHGMGLPIVAQLVDSLGGEIRLTSQVGVGSCFVIQLPG